MQFIIRVEPRGVFRFGAVNRALLEVTGLKAAQVVGKKVDEVIPAASCRMVLKKYREAIRTGKTVCWEETSDYPAGVRHGEVSVTPSYDRDGRATHLFGVVHDITSRKLIEEALQRSEERYRFLADNTDDIVTLTDAKNRNLYISPSYFRETGFTMEKLAGTNWLTRVHPDDRALARRNRKENRAGRQTTIEIRVARADGSWMWVESTCKPVFGPDGKVDRLLIWGHNITARKKTEEALLESESRFRAIFEQAAVGVAVIDTSTGRFLSVNQRACDIARLTREQMLGTSYRPLCHPDDNRLDDEYMERLKAGKIRDFTMEKRYMHQDGSITWISLTVSPLWKPGEEPLRHIAVVEDITGRIKAQFALQKSEERYARAVRATNEGIWERSFAEDKLYFSPRWKALLGFADDELPNDVDVAFYQRLHPDDLPVVEKTRREKLGSFLPYVLEVRLRVKSGEYRWFQIRAQAEADAEGRPVIVSGSMADITERKHTQDALRESEARFRAVFEQAAVGVGTMDMDTGRYLEVNQRYCNFVGRTREDIKSGSFDAVTHPEDLPENLRLHRQLKAGKISEYAIDKRYVRPDGSTLWGHLHVTRIVASDGSPDRLLAIVEDITERKRAEENYQRELGFIETLVNHTSAIIVLLDDRARMIHVNDTVVRLLGFSRSELLNRSPWDVGMMDAAERDRSMARFTRVLEGQPNPPREVTLYGKDGTPHAVELTSFATRKPDGKPDRIIVTGTDVTERRRMQREILKIAEQEQARMGHNLHDGVGQTMTGLVSMIEALEHELSGEQRVRAERIRQVVQDSVQEVRQMSHGLSPMAVKNRGLGGALRLLADTVRMNHRIACACEIDHNLRFADTEKEAHVYRIAQEAVNNALRHGRPKNIAISLTPIDDQRCMLKVEDDGTGFKTSKGTGAGDGIGRRIMDYRASLIGGSVEVNSKRGRGVTVICRFSCGGG